MSVLAAQGRPPNGPSDSRQVRHRPRRLSTSTFDATQAAAKKVLGAALPGPLGHVAAAWLKPECPSSKILVGRRAA